ncbi:sugar ABC transporter permease, partial [Myceligenerans sp. TRM 65318]|nr:sugar ABC transporter permease [Myceligenerans sp. TRM 65318]MBE3016375.1 sugar ABC transporter permease [Myceligenerans sp. TRM 65318]
MAALTSTEPAAGSTTPAPRAPRRVGFSQTLGRWDVKVSPYLYISPFFVLF